jgi:hypothetical protein
MTLSQQPLPTEAAPTADGIRLLVDMLHINNQAAYCLEYSMNVPALWLTQSLSGSKCATLVRGLKLG